MADQQVREIQLGGKQLVFLFMASVVVAVAIFLLGVSVGRGVRESSAGQAAVSSDVAVSAAPSAPSVELPPETETKPEDLQYHDQLQGTTPPAAAAPAPASAAAVTGPAAESARPVSGQAGSAAAPPAKEPSPKAPPTIPKDAPAKEPARPAAAAVGGWYVQANAFRSRANADRQAAELRSKGYANVAVAGGGRAGGLFRVRIGPFADRADADRVADRLRKEERVTPSISQ